MADDMGCGAPRAPPQLRDHEPWPLANLRANLAKREPSDDRPRCVIVTTGAMNPPHRGHAQLLRQAQQRLEEAGYEVIAGWMSPSNDEYVRPKASRLRTQFFGASLRLYLASLTLQGDEFLSVGAWEAQVPGRWPDFPEVTEQLQTDLGRLPEADQGLRGSSGRVRVFYCCGTDHASNCGLYRGICGGKAQDFGTVVVPRTGETPRAEDPSKNVFVAAPADGEVAGFSSTKVRQALADREAEYVSKAISPEAARLIVDPTSEELAAFSELQR